VLAVKPKELGAALEATRSFVTHRPVFLSIAAGRPIRAMVEVLGESAAVVRAMPNTPAAIAQGMTVLTANRAATDEQRALCSELLSAVGAVAWIDDERQMDAVTAVSGCGPAYVFLLIECLQRAGMELGLDRALARELATVTVAGAGAYARASSEDAAELRRRVASPGGTTEAALAILAGEHGLDALLRRAVRAAEQRGRELAR
jgi:pyrroline-5-carboxylate reductase